MFRRELVLWSEERSRQGRYKRELEKELVVGGQGRKGRRWKGERKPVEPS